MTEKIRQTKKIIAKDIIRVISPFRGHFIVKDPKKIKFWKAQADREPAVNIHPVRIKVPLT